MTSDAKPRPKRLPLLKRFNAALTEEAYAKLRELNSKWGLGNNYLLTVLLETLDETVDPERLDAAFERFIAEYGAPGLRQAQRNDHDSSM